MTFWFSRARRFVRPLVCDFCGRSEHEVTSLVAGWRAYICDTCTDKCRDIVVQERSKGGTQG